MRLHMPAGGQMYWWWEIWLKYGMREYNFYKMEGPAFSKAGDYASLKKWMLWRASTGCEY